MKTLFRNEKTITKTDGSDVEVHTCSSINEAKRQSRQLQKMGWTYVRPQA